MGEDGADTDAHVGTAATLETFGKAEHLGHFRSDGIDAGKQHPRIAAVEDSLGFGQGHLDHGRRH